MAMFEMSPEQVVEWRQKMREMVTPQVNGEVVVAAAAFRQGGATASMVASKAQLGGAIYAGIKMLRKKQAGGLPERVMLALTPDKLYAFKFTIRGKTYKIGDEVAVWDRADLEVSTDHGGSMTALTISSPAEGEKATLVGVGVKDDPISQELIAALQGQAPTTA